MAPWMASLPAWAPAPKMAALPNFLPAFLIHSPCWVVGRFCQLCMVCMYVWGVGLEVVGCVYEEGEDEDVMVVGK